MLARKRDRERKTDITETDDSNVHESEPLLCGGRKGDLSHLQIG
jgi:hypothetical protein